LKDPASEGTRLSGNSDFHSGNDVVIWVSQMKPGHGHQILQVYLTAPHIILAKKDGWRASVKISSKTKPARDKCLIGQLGAGDQDGNRRIKIIGSEGRPR